MVPSAHRTGWAVRRAGFTLIELLVATAILGGIIAVTGACLAGGMRLWETAHGYARGEPDIYFAMNWMRRDWANTFRFYAIQCKGAEDSVVFPGLAISVDGPAGDGTGIVRRICQIKYFMDRPNSAFCRKQWFFPEPEPGDVLSEKLVSDVDVVEFRYRRHPLSGPEGGWQEAWTDGSNLPHEVRVRIHPSGQRVRGEIVERVLARQGW